MRYLIMREMAIRSAREGLPADQKLEDFRFNLITPVSVVGCSVETAKRQWKEKHSHMPLNSCEVIWLQEP